MRKNEPQMTDASCLMLYWKALRYYSKEGDIRTDEGKRIASLSPLLPASGKRSMHKRKQLLPYYFTEYSTYILCTAKLSGEDWCRFLRL